MSLKVPEHAVSLYAVTATPDPVIESPHGARFARLSLEVLTVRFVRRKIGDDRVRLDCTVGVRVPDVQRPGHKRDLKLSHFVDWDLPTTDETWALLEAEAYAATMRFAMAHELAETVRDARGDHYVHPHPSPLQAGAWETELQSLTEEK